MNLIRETKKMTRKGISIEYRLLGTCHVWDSGTLTRWRKMGGKEPEVVDIYAGHSSHRSSQEVPGRP